MHGLSEELTEYLFHRQHVIDPLIREQRSRESQYQKRYPMVATD